MAPAIESSNYLVTSRIVKAAIRVHEMTGPGSLEAPFKLALAIEMADAGLTFRQDVWIPLCRDTPQGHGYAIDFVVEGAVIVEVKAVAELAGVHRTHMLSCLEAAGFQIGLLLNFNVASMPSGVRRVLNPSV